MSEWLFLLLPVSAVSGGYAAWRYFKKYYLVDRVQGCAKHTVEG